MPSSPYPRDRFDDVEPARGRVGAHRAESPRMRGGVIVLWALVATILLVLVGIVGTLVSTGRFGAVPEQPAASAPTVTAGTEAVIDTSYTVVILNASGIDGAAAKMRDELVAAGWSADDVLPSDAGAEYAKTTVYYAKKSDAAAAAGLAQLVGAGTAHSDEYQNADDPDAAQLVIVIGTDRRDESAAPGGE